MRDFLKVYWPLALVALIGLIIALRFVEPAPPRTVTMAAGSPGGAYYAFAERYQTILAEDGVTLELIESGGSLDNLSMLLDGDASIALLQGGIANPGDGDQIRSLGGLFYEPFWVFVRNGVDAADFGDLRDYKVAVGGEGSGTRKLALDVSREFARSWPEGWDVALGGSAAVDALRAGDVDAAAFSASIDAAYIAGLLRDPSVNLLPFDRASALSRRADALAPVTLLRGVVDIGGDIPERDVRLIAPVAQLAVRDDLHPAIQSLLLEAATVIHTDGSLLSRAGRFPDADLTDLPLSKEARRYYERGPSALRSYFSFGVANFLERAWILLIPLLTLMIPLIRVAPPIYRWRVRRKIYVWYSDLRDLEARGRAAKTAADRDLVRQQLLTLQEEVGRLDVPLSYTDDLYRLRNHIAFVSQLLGNLDPRQQISHPAA
ncbi:MAG: TAXI family TRAP transporter solute-binding subunit [Pseudomonadota bacterium]